MMESATNYSAGLVELVLAAIAGIVWMIRLEGKIKAQNDMQELRSTNIGLRAEKLDKDHSDLRQRFERLEDKIVQKLSTIEKSLSNIEGRLSFQNKHFKGESSDE